MPGVVEAYIQETIDEAFARHDLEKKLVDSLCYDPVGCEQFGMNPYEAYCTALQWSIEQARRRMKQMREANPNATWRELLAEYQRIKDEVLAARDGK